MPTTLVHGTLNSYQHHKCRCDLCKRASANAADKYRKRRKELNTAVVSHGTTGYSQGCKCEICRTSNAARKYVKRYGITIDEYDTLLRSQNGVCAICSREPVDGQRLAVDHDHKTGKVRGLLCFKCNTGLGHLGDSLDTLKRAVDYLSG